MADLPEHAAQVALLTAFKDPCYRFDQLFEINWFTPYLLGYLLARAFAVVLSVHAAIKLTVFVSVIALPLAMRELLRRLGGQPRLSLLGFPLAFGFSFYWGFLNFSLAIAIGLVHLAIGAAVLRQPNRRNVIALASLSLLLLISHAFMLIICSFLLTTLAVFHIRRLPLVLLALAPALAGLTAWSVSVRSTEASVHREVVWHLGLYRILEMPSILLSNEWDPWAALFIAGIALAIVASRPALSRDPRRWVILAVAAAIYLFAPLSAFGSAFLFQRLAVLVAAGALVVLELPVWRQALHVALVVLILCWFALLTVRFRAFDAEAREFDAIVERVPANRRLLLFTMNPFSSAIRGPLFLHFAAYYQVRKGGVAAWSFANYYPQVVRYRKRAEPRVASPIVPQGRPVDWAGVTNYDFVAFRAATRAPEVMMRAAPFRSRLVYQRGAWWLFETERGSRSTSPRCEPLE